MRPLVCTIVYSIEKLKPSMKISEYHLFNALRKTCLIESRETSNYNRCGRTDKGVSAFGQVISIDLRSKFPELEQMVPVNIDNEIDYCSILNRVLPKNIRCIAWMPLRNKLFSARFVGCYCSDDIGCNGLLI